MTDGVKTAVVPVELVVRGLRLMADHFAIQNPTQRTFNVRGWPNMPATTSEAFSEVAKTAADLLSAAPATQSGLVSSSPKSEDTYRAADEAVLTVSIRSIARDHAHALVRETRGRVVFLDAYRNIVSWLEAAEGAR